MPAGEGTHDPQGDKQRKFKVPDYLNTLVKFQNSRSRKHILVASRKEKQMPLKIQKPNRQQTSYYKTADSLGNSDFETQRRTNLNIEMGIRPSIKCEDDVETRKNSESLLITVPRTRKLLKEFL